MKRFKFSLQRVLDYRETIEESKLAELAAVRAEYEAESRRLDEMVAAKERFVVRLRETLQQGAPDEIRQSFNFLQELNDRVTYQQAKLIQVEQKEQRKLEEVMEASKDRKAMERLKDYKLEEHKSETAQLEQKFMDEIAGVRHSRSRTVGSAGEAA